MSPQQSEAPKDFEGWTRVFDPNGGNPTWYSPDAYYWWMENDQFIDNNPQLAHLFVNQAESIETGIEVFSAPQTDYASLWLEALRELKPEIDLYRNERRPVPAQPPLSEVLAEYGHLPEEALFMGVASDGLPMLLNLHDPVPGPLAIIGDAGTGKTGLLQTIARAAGIMHQSKNVQFGVLTSHPDEWSAFKNIPNNVGVFPFYANSAQEFLLSLASWAHGNKNRGQSVVLLLDDLGAATNLDFDARQNLRWLLLRGPARRVWPIVTLNTDSSANLQPWLNAFHTRIFGPIQDQGRARSLNAQGADLGSLNRGTQFALREGDHWLSFWTPAID